MRTIILALALLQAGCASLRVEVSVLDPQVVEREQDRRAVRTRLPLVLAEDAMSIKAEVGRVSAGHLNLYVELTEAYLEEAKRSNRAELATIANEFQPQFGKTIGPAYEALTLDLIDLNTRIRRAYNTPVEEGKVEASTRDSLLAVLVGEYGATKRRVQKLFFDDTTSIIAAASEVKPSLRDSVAVRSSVARGLLTNRVLVNDSPYLFAIANADEAAWQSKYNNVLGRGQLGGMDIAIKVDDAQDFTLKGMTFDPRDVAKAISRAGTQALAITAQVLGVPAVTETGKKGPPGTASTTEVTAAMSAAVEAEKTAMDLEVAARAIAFAVIDGSAEWQSEDPATRKAAIAALRQLIATLKPKLSPALATKPSSETGPSQPLME